MQLMRYLARKNTDAIISRFVSIFILILIIFTAFIHRSTRTVDTVDSNPVKQTGYSQKHDYLIKVKLPFDYNTSGNMLLNKYRPFYNTVFTPSLMNNITENENDEQEGEQASSNDGSSESKEQQTEQQTQHSEVINDPNIIKTYDVPAGHSFKSYTNYKLLSQSSAQGKLQQRAYTGESGIRMVDDCYCAALGTYYDGNIGDKFLVTLSTGKQFKMILCDVKSNNHTDPMHQYTMLNGCVVEFYVDYDVLDDLAKRMGNISYIEGFEGDVTLIQKIQN